MYVCIYIYIYRDKKLSPPTRSPSPRDRQAKSMCIYIYMLNPTAAGGANQRAVGGSAASFDKT